MTTPSVPKDEATPQKRSGFSSLEAIVFSPLARTISTQFTVLSKNPNRKELLSPEVPEKPPPAVMPGNSITTGGINPCSSVSLTSASMGTFGSVKTVFFCWSTLRIHVSALISTMFSFRYWEGRVLFVEPWYIRNGFLRSKKLRTREEMPATATS